MEGLANHRGSAFGGYLASQPTHINFENALAVDLLNLQSDILVVEDESRTIGRLVIPDMIFQRMKKEHLVILDIPFEIRLNNIYDEYITSPLNNGVSHSQLRDSLIHSLLKIKNRLGEQHFTTIYNKIEYSFSKYKKTSSHKTWISDLLKYYYDPIYDYQLTQKDHRCVFRGDIQDVTDFFNSFTMKL